MKLNFIKVNPTENMTVFVLDQIPRSMYMDIATKIMDYSNVYAEQVGFLENISSEDSEACVRVHMMGGEFCGNAARALAAILVQRKHCKIQREESKFIVPLEVSGTNEIINCEVEHNDINSFISTAKMPLHKSIKDISIEYKDTVHKGTLVEFPGIVHLIVNSQGIDEKEDFFEIIKEKFNDLNYDALGIMFFNEENSYMEPLVYVKLTESLIWERGCGSGTAALGIVFSHRLKKSIDMVVKQPGGQLEIFTDWNENKINSIYLKGVVNIVAEGIAYI
ncbi:diaminopimelate epimerase [Tepidibacter aestuarii]|uniref:diaminopimelate epimerase n=1 Tax=Tepidibacter aestuarii TaxID=2925782 RepID=UPI0020BFCAB5|nr:diaminopimelate epimerase [Tepidibacter aestuarii]CAH2213061.1 histidine racemase [Tepidibacter aestuarii]